jgi:hypothetical protein
MSGRKIHLRREAAILRFVPVAAVVDNAAYQQSLILNLQSTK